MSVLFGGLILELVVDMYDRGCIIGRDVVGGVYLRALVASVVASFVPYA